MLSFRIMFSKSVSPVRLAVEYLSKKATESLPKTFITLVSYASWCSLTNILAHISGFFLEYLTTLVIDDWCHKHLNTSAEVPGITTN